MIPQKIVTNCSNTAFIGITAVYDELALIIQQHNQITAY